VNSQRLIQEQGFEILPAVLSPREAQQLADNLYKAMLHRSRAGVRHALKHPAVVALAHDPRLLHIVRGILGKEAIPLHATLFDKSSQSNWLVVWHQDIALPLRERHDTPGWGPWSIKDGVVYAHAPASALCRVVALRIHLDDSTVHNGPLRVLPRTHTLGVLSAEAIQERAAQISPTDCLVPQGGVLVMRPLIIHASSKSESDMPRRVLHIEYCETAMIDTNLELAVP
jgi:ectoine hydroxylase-related dioxygenase (phytanoyl-CoA dioxygenase family)